MLIKPLSKSALQAGEQCPRMLWFRYNMSYRKEDEDTTKFEIGNIVGEIAQKYFDDGETVVIDTSAGFSPDNYADYAAQTAAAMEDPSVTCIAEAAFYTGDIIVFVDLFHRNPDGSWDIFEVKSTKIAKPVHAQDCAWQTYVVRTLCGINVRYSYIMIPMRGWSVIAERREPFTYFYTYEPDGTDMGIIDEVLSQLGLDAVEEALSEAFARRYGSLVHPYGVWQARLGADGKADDPLVRLFCEEYADSRDIEAAADYAVGTVDREEHFLVVDDYTDWIYEQSVGDEIPGKVSYLVEMVQQPEPPQCGCASPGSGFECFQPYECQYQEVCAEFFAEGR